MQRQELRKNFQEEAENNIASCMGFAPAQNPKVIALVLIDEPPGIYYGGTIAAPVISKLLDDILPYVDGKEDYGYSGN